MIRRLPGPGGKQHAVDPRFRVSRTSTGYVLRGEGATFAVEADEEGVIAADTVAGLFARRALQRPVWERPALCEAIFGWNPKAEIEALVELLGDARPGQRGLDVGCGFGRLLVPLRGRGWRLDGVDESALLARRALAVAPPLTKVFVAPIECFAVPGAYDFGFAALNTLRYLETRHALERHLHAAATWLRPGGAYAVHLSIQPEEAVPTRPVSWRFDWQGVEHRVEWSWYDYCHLRRLLIERVRVEDVSGRIVHEEYQAQGHYTASVLRSLAGPPDWRLERVLTEALEASPMDVEAPARRWILLRRTERTGV